MLTTRTVALGIAAVTGLCGLAFGQVEPEAKQKLEDMAKAIKDAKAISYKVESRCTGGMMASFIPAAKLEMTLQHDPASPSVWKTRATGRRDEVSGQGGVPAIDIRIVSDGTKVTWVDDASKTVIERFTGAAANNEQVMSVSLYGLRELTEAQPFNKDLAAPTIKNSGTATADGVECTVIFADQGSGQYQSRWTIGPDNLPRKLERVMAGVGTQVWTLTDVKLNPDIPEGTFAISTPQGYTFSPAAPPPAPKPAADPTGAAGTTTTPGAGTTTTPAHERAIGNNVGDLAPEFELTSTTGEKVSLSSLKGNVVVLDFWGTWCAPCKKISPEIQKLADTYKDKPVRILGLSVRETSDDAVANYTKEHGYTYTQLLKADDVAKKLYKVKIYPTFFVIGKDGEILQMSPGVADESTPDVKPEERTIPQITAAIERGLSGEKAKKKAIPLVPAGGAGSSDAAK